MNTASAKICEQAVGFVKEFFRLYLVQGDFDLLVQKMDKQMSWFGAHKICNNLDEVQAMLRAEAGADIHFHITKEWYTPAAIEENKCTVYGEMELLENMDKIKPLAICFSLVCGYDSCGAMKLYHGHFSAKNLEPPKEFADISPLWGCDMQKEQKLWDNGARISGKALEAITLVNNKFVSVELCTADENLTILYISSGFTQMTGYTREDIRKLPGGSHKSLMFAEDIRSMADSITECVRKGDGYSVEYRLKRKDGSIIWVHNDGVVLKDRGGKSQLQNILTDITEHKNIENSLRISENRYEIAIKASDVTMYEYDLQTDSIQLFEHDRELFGVVSSRPNAVESMINDGVIDPEYVDNFREMFARIKKGEPEAQCYVIAYGTDGQAHQLELKMTTIYDETGAPIRAIGVRKNVTQLHKLMKEQAYSSVMTSNQMLTYEADITRNKIMWRNPEWAAEYGLTEAEKFSEVVDYMCLHFVAPEDSIVFLEKLSADYIKNAYLSGKRLISMEYRKKTGANEYKWFRNNVNIVMDLRSGDVNIRCYIRDIDEEKTLALKALDDRQLYDAIFAKANLIYEVDITDNTVISVQGKWLKYFGVKPGSKYTDMIENAKINVLYKDDIKEFTKVSRRDYLLEQYAKGVSQVVYDYRRPNEDGKYIWVRATLHLFGDGEAGRVKGHIYIEDIDSDKKRELDLIYRSEHDMLTGYYDKLATERYISEFLDSDEGKMNEHAFFIIDIDRFKAVNDNFGHAFGDAVLCSITGKIREFFREGDILGRVGGDEFVVLMKNIQDKEIALRKAKEICDRVQNSYTKNNMLYLVSASVGIAFYSTQGTSFEELYRHSDTALYVSKGGGRGQYTVYNSNMAAYPSNIKEITPNEYLKPKSLQANIDEHVFRILHEDDDKIMAIESVLELIGRQFNISRVSILEKDINRKSVRCTFEWCAEHTNSQKDKLQGIENSKLAQYYAEFGPDGMLHIVDVEHDSSFAADILRVMEVKGSLQFKLTKNGVTHGMICYDECRGSRRASASVMKILQRVSAIIGSFIIEMRGMQENLAAKKMSISILNSLSCYAYVCNPQSHRLEFANGKTLKKVPEAVSGALCYEVFYGRDKPCDACPMKFVGNAEQKSAMVLNGSALGEKIMVTCTVIDSGDGELCLLDCVDMEEYGKI